MHLRTTLQKFSCIKYSSHKKNDDYMDGSICDVKNRLFFISLLLLVYLMCRSSQVFKKSLLCHYNRFFVFTYLFFIPYCFIVFLFLGVFCALSVAFLNIFFVFRLYAVFFCVFTMFLRCFYDVFFDLLFYSVFLYKLKLF